MLSPGSFREIARTVSVSYPIPFLFICSLAFALCCFSGSIVVDGGLRWLPAAIGSMASLSAITLMIFAILRRPELLRSERHTLINRDFDMIGDSDMTEAAREVLQRAIAHGFPEAKVAKRRASLEPLEDGKAEESDG